MVALKDIQLTIQPRASCLPAGPSGCGKSTLLNAVAGFQLPSAGEITIEGKNPRAPARSRHGVSEYAFVSVDDRGQNIAFGLEVQRKPQRHRPTVNQLLGLAAPEDFRDRYPKDLSGGMRQRGGDCHCVWRWIRRSC